MSTRTRIAAVLALAVLTTAQSGATPASPAEALELVRTVAANLPDFDLQGEPVVFTSENLWDHINGDADRYLAYKYQWTATGALVHRTSGVKVLLDLYRFTTDLDAFGAHSMDRSRVEEARGLALPGGTSPLAAYLSRDQLRIWRGPFAVVITPASLAGDLSALSLEVGRATCRELPPCGPLPRQLRLLPRQGLLLQTLRFQRDNVFGREGLGNAVLGAYGSPNGASQVSAQFELALFDAAGVEGGSTAREMQLTGILLDGGRFEEALEFPAGVARGTHPRFGEYLLTSTDQFVVLAHHIRDGQAAQVVVGQALSRAKRSLRP